MWRDIALLLWPLAVIAVVVFVASKTLDVLWSWLDRREQAYRLFISRNVERKQREAIQRRHEQRSADEQNCT